MSADLQSSFFSNIGVHSNVVQQTIQSNQSLTKKISRGRMATDNSECLDIQSKVAV